MKHMVLVICVQKYDTKEIIKYWNPIYLLKFKVNKKTRNFKLAKKLI